MYSKFEFQTAKTSITKQFHDDSIVAPYTQQANQRKRETSR